MDICDITGLDSSKMSIMKDKAGSCAINRSKETRVLPTKHNAWRLTESWLKTKPAPRKAVGTYEMIEEKFFECDNERWYVVEYPCS